MNIVNFEFYTDDKYALASLMKLTKRGTLRIYGMTDDMSQYKGMALADARDIEWYQWCYVHHQSVVALKPICTCGCGGYFVGPGRNTWEAFDINKFYTGN